MRGAKKGLQATSCSPTILPLYPDGGEGGGGYRLHERVRAHIKGESSFLAVLRDVDSACKRLCSALGSGHTKHIRVRRPMRCRNLHNNGVWTVNRNAFLLVRWPVNSKKGYNS